ncbi:penicillin-binding protein activator LpoB [bacterium]|nr:penicillin-binding protein activator LpoB [bacterium]
MRTMITRILPVMILAALLAVTGCSGGKQVTRVDTGEQIDLSGRWNDTDSQMVSAALVGQILATPWVEDFLAEKGKKPTVIIAPVANKTSEHIATQTLTADLERQFINGGRVKVVASADERDQVRTERADQQEFASPETMKQWGRERGADFMLIGEINTQNDSEEGTELKYYQVDCYLVDLQDNTKVWAGFEKIKKVVGRGKYKP